MSRLRIFIVAVGLSLLAPGSVPAGLSCVGLARPVPGSIVQPFAPIGRFAGHWGVDLEAAIGAQVTVAASGVVTFAGVVAGNSTISVDHGGGLKTSYSFLSDRGADRGSWVGRGARIGLSDEHDGSASLHFSVRVDGVYVDPTAFLGCQAAPPADALRLVPVR